MYWYELFLPNREKIMPSGRIFHYRFHQGSVMSHRSFQKVKLYYVFEIISPQSKVVISFKIIFFCNCNDLDIQESPKV